MAEWIRISFGMASEVGRGIGVLDGGGYRRQEWAVLGVNLGRLFVTILWKYMQQSSCCWGREWCWSRSVCCEVYASVMCRRWNVAATFICFVLRRWIQLHWLWIRCYKGRLWRSWYV